MLERTLADADVRPPTTIGATLHTAFDRLTLAARDSAARLTCDLGVRLARTDGETARMRDGLVLVESKSEDGDGPADGVLRELGCEPISLSKFRVGVDLLLRRDPTGETERPRRLFA